MRLPPGARQSTNIEDRRGQKSNSNRSRGIVLRRGSTMEPNNTGHMGSEHKSKLNGMFNRLRGAPLPRANPFRTPPPSLFRSTTAKTLNKKYKAKTTGRW